MNFITTSNDAKLNYQRVVVRLGERAFLFSFNVKQRILSNTFIHRYDFATSFVIIKKRDSYTKIISSRLLIQLCSHVQHHCKKSYLNCNVILESKLVSLIKIEREREWRYNLLFCCIISWSKSSKQFRFIILVAVHKIPCNIKKLIKVKLLVPNFQLLYLFHRALYHCNIKLLWKECFFFFFFLYNEKRLIILCRAFLSALIRESQVFNTKHLKVA